MIRKKHLAALLFLFLATLFAAGCRSRGEVKAPPPTDPERFLYCTNQGESAIFYDLSGVWADEQSSVAVRRSETEIVFTIRAYHPPRSPLRCEGKDGDPLSLFAGEHTELFLIPGDDQHIYYHFAVNPLGRTYLACRREVSETMEGVRITVKREKDFWDSEYRISYAAIGAMPPQEQTLWRVNFCRCSASKTGKPQWSAWNHSGSFHDISTMGALVFGTCEKLPPPPLRRIVREKDKVVLEVADVARTPLAEIKEGKIIWERKVVSPGVLTFFRRVTPAFHPLKSDVMLIYHAKGKKSETIISRSAPPAGDFLLPDRFYYTGEPIVCRTGALAGTLRLLDNTGDLLQSVPVTGGRGVLESAPLEPGNYIVEFQTAEERTTRSIVRCQGWRPLDFPGGPITVDPQFIRRGGKPVYLLGISDEPAKDSFYPFAPEFTYGRSCGLAKNAVRLGSIPGGRIIRVNYNARLMYEKPRQIARYEEFFGELSPDPDSIYRLEYEAGLPLYFGRDEASKLLCTDQPGWYQSVAEQAKKHRPEILLSLHLDSQSQLAEYAKAADVMEFSDWTASFAEDDMMRHLPGAIARLRKTVPGKPVIFWLGGSIPDGKSRTPEELRAGIYLSILAGFSGNVIHTGHDGIAPERTRMWSFLCGISREIAEFYPRWVTAQEIPYTLPEAFAGKARKLPDGTVMLLVVNLRDGENRLTAAGRMRCFTPYEAALITWKEENQPLKQGE